MKYMIKSIVLVASLFDKALIPLSNLNLQLISYKSNIKQIQY